MQSRMTSLPIAFLLVTSEVGQNIASYASPVAEFSSAVQLNRVQLKVAFMRSEKPIIHSTPSLRHLPNVAFEMVQVFGRPGLFRSNNA